MKKLTRLLRAFLPLLGIVLFSSQAVSAPYGPGGRKVKWVQPDGQELVLRVFGDEFYGRTETQDGYTVVFDAAKRGYYYAERNADESEFKSSGLQAHKVAPAGMGKHVELNVDAVRSLRGETFERFAGERSKRWANRVAAVRSTRTGSIKGRGLPQLAAKIDAAPVEGDIVGLTILAQFPDGGAGPVDFPTDQAKIVRYCNEEGYNDDGNTGSIRDYFSDQSLDKVDYTQAVTPVITLPNPRDYYNFDDSGGLRDAGDAGRLLIADAIEELEKINFDFSTLTKDGNNNVLATNVFFAGPDSGVWAAGLWPHQWNVDPIDVGSNADPIYINNYQITNLEDDAPYIGTFIHENGHLLLDYPDLYDIVGEGVGRHCLMGSGNYLNDGKTPAPINVYLKDFVGWANVTEISAADALVANLPSTGNVAYRISNPMADTESFYVENRGNGDKWAEYAVDKGVMIWHVDETVNGNILSDPYQVSLEQADGAFDLEAGINRGDDTDLYDLQSNLFSSTSTPNSDWWSDGESSVKIKALENPGSNVTVKFGSLPPDTILLDSPNGGEVAFLNTDFTIRWRSSIIGNVKVELYRNGRLYSVLSASAPNTGRFVWSIPELAPIGKNFKIRLSSISNPKPASDISQEPFEITDRSFPEKGKKPYGWAKAKNAAASWNVSESRSYEGAYSLKSNKIGDGKVAAISFSSNFKNGAVSFYVKVSSENGYDAFNFYIDGVRQKVVPGSKKGVSGYTGWKFFSFDISKGNHTFKWAYEKDDSYESGRDAAWLDGVTLPPTTQEIAIKNSKGKTLQNGKASCQFSNTPVGFKSKSKIYTITNTGMANLFGLKTKMKGEHSESFGVSKLAKTALKPGESTEFKVVFAPSARGVKDATIKIFSTDVNESPFIIQAKGKAIVRPKMKVYLSNGKRLKGKNSKVKFGNSRVGRKGGTKTIVLKNTGLNTLKNLAVRETGEGQRDFKVKGLKVKSLAPGESTSFKVIFKPKKKGKRRAKLKITHRYDKGASVVNLVGTGKSGGSNASRSSAMAVGLARAVLGDAGTAQTSGVGSNTTTDIIGGDKYLVLTVTKPEVPDGRALRVEVSPNLIDWFSGSKHTTILEDNERVLKVRDNTPVSADAKRYIRVKSYNP
jgi:M6 family metalloprotease-like protein